jgi:DNA polymerase-3 subunit epsilon
MSQRSKLVRDSKIARDLITLLRRGNGRLSLAQAAWQTMRMKSVSDARLREIFGNLVGQDPRFVVDARELRLAEDPRERLPLAALEFTVLDTETTGSSPTRGDRLTEVGAVRVRNGAVVDRYSTLVNPCRPIPPAITRLTGIDDRMVASAPTFDLVVDELLDFLGDTVVVAHNAPFDRAFLDAELRLSMGRALLAPYVCTVQLSRRVVPGLESYRLDALADYFGVRIANRHRALGDAEATGEIFCRLLESLHFHDVPDLRSARLFRHARESAAS